MSKTYRIALPFFFLWLLLWIGLSWPAIQDDALIHLRYADNLRQFHRITYDGEHRDYGASSLLYVSLLAMLRWLSDSANLARAVSSSVHVLLFAGLGWGLSVRGKRWPQHARLAGLILLFLLIAPGAVRWLDDGMETGIAVALASLLAWRLHDEKERACAGATTGTPRFLAMAALGCLIVLLRIELSLLCLVGVLILGFSTSETTSAGHLRWSSAEALGRSSHLLVGGLIAAATIFATMHTLLPDTAKAKSLGIAYWLRPIHDTAITLGGAMSFGVGVMAFWVITLVMVIMLRGRLPLSSALANCFFPIVLVLASLRGQEIQGVRYFAWTFFFPIVWNLLELGENGEAKRVTAGRWLLYGFIGLLLVDLPFESVAMHRVLTRRAATMREFSDEHLEQLNQARGVASDIGYIGYFTRANLCDLAGLVNGPAAAMRTSSQRAAACMASDPDFLFLNAGQLRHIAAYRDLSRWGVCGRYDFANVSTRDSHYLIVRPGLADAACQATGKTMHSMDSVLLPSGAGL